MTDRPILFSAPMVRALLAGTKTQTRRTLRRARVFATPETKPFTLTGGDLERALQGADRFRHLGQDGWFWEADAFEWQAPATRTGWMAHISYAPGDRLWVKEQFIPDPSADHDAWDDWKASYYEWSGTGCRLDMVPPTLRKPACVLFKADPRWQGDQGFKWRPSIHMPRWASRLTLTVTEVRVERLQDISEADAIAEGIGRDMIPDGLIPGGNTGFGFADCSGFDTAKSAYAVLWDSINGPGSWASDPWVVAVSFEVRQGNIDA